jgi:hypothetical protein
MRIEILPLFIFPGVLSFRSTTYIYFYRRNKMKYIFCTALILFAATGIFAQGRTISQTEFESVLKNPNKMAPVIWKGKTWRMIITTEVKAEGQKPVDSSTKSITEFASGQTSRVILEIRQGSKITQSEKIRIKDKIYIRNGDEAWTVEAFEEKQRAETTGTTASTAPANSKFERQTEFKYLGSEVFNNQKTNVYAEVIKRKSTDPALKTSYTQTMKYWLNEDGTLLRDDLVMEGRNETGAFYNRRTIIYELDPNIKIEAPAIN